MRPANQKKTSASPFSILLTRIMESVDSADWERFKALVRALSEDERRALLFACENAEMLGRLLELWR